MTARPPARFHKNGRNSGRVVANVEELAQNPVSSPCGNGGESAAVECVSCVCELWAWQDKPWLSGEKKKGYAVVCGPSVPSTERDPVIIDYGTLFTPIGNRVGLQVDGVVGVAGRGCRLDRGRRSAGGRHWNQFADNDGEFAFAATNDATTSSPAITATRATGTDRDGAAHRWHPHRPRGGRQRGRRRIQRPGSMPACHAVRRHRVLLTSTTGRLLWLGMHPRRVRRYRPPVPAADSTRDERDVLPVAGRVHLSRRAALHPPRDV